MPSQRGILYIVWGHKVDRLLERSIASVKAVHPDLSIHVSRVESESNRAESLCEKAYMFARSPFSETLYLDADTVVLDRLDYGFEKARQFGLACCICESPWARRFRGLADQGDMIEYNTGVIFFTNSARSVFSLWPRLAGQLDSSATFLHEGKTPVVQTYNDQAGFAAAVDRAGSAPFVLPRNWNFRYGFEKTFFGPLKIWHSYRDVPGVIFRLSEYYRRADAVIQYTELE